VVMYGADPDQLDELARKIKILGDALAKCHGPVDVQVRIAPWQGPAADRFRHDWARTHRPAILNAAHSLQHAQEVLIRNANEQRKASGITDPAPAHAGGGRSGGLFSGVVGAVVGGATAAVHAAEVKAKETASAVDRAVDSVRDEAGDVVHDAAAGAHELGGDVTEWNHDMVSSPYFKDAVVGLQIISVVAPFIPGGQVVAVAAAALIVTADVMKMANTGKWDAGKLAVDGLALAGGGVSLAGKIPRIAAAVRFAGMEGAEALPRAGAVLSASGSVVDGVLKGRDLVTDLRAGHYSAAAIDSVEIVGALASTGSAAHASSVAHANGQLHDAADAPSAADLHRSTDLTDASNFHNVAPEPAPARVAQGFDGAAALAKEGDAVGRAAETGNAQATVNAMADE
jgi:hypothetical protein